MGRKESSEASWHDIAIPCWVLMKEVDVPEVTENPVFQTEVLNCTLNRDFLLTRHGWLKAEQFELIEIVTPPPTEEGKK